MKKYWCVDWVAKEPEFYDTAAEAYNAVFDEISTYPSFSELREELAASYDRDEEDYGIDNIVTVTSYEIY